MKNVINPEEGFFPPPHQRTLQGKDGGWPRLLQRLHAAPPPASPETVRLPRLQMEPPAEQRRVLPALPLRLVRTLLWTHIDIYQHLYVKYLTSGLDQNFWSYGRTRLLGGLQV